MEVQEVGCETSDAVPEKAWHPVRTEGVGGALAVETDRQEVEGRNGVDEPSGQIARRAVHRGVIGELPVDQHLRRGSHPAECTVDSVCGDVRTPVTVGEIDVEWTNGHGGTGPQCIG